MKNFVESHWVLYLILLETLLFSFALFALALDQLIIGKIALLLWLIAASISIGLIIKDQKIKKRKSEHILKHS